MNRNLQSLALAAVVRPYWDNYNFDELERWIVDCGFRMSGGDDEDHPALRPLLWADPWELERYFSSKPFWMPGVIKFGSEIHKFGLPPLLETELMLVVLEFGKRKFSKARQRYRMKLPPERPPTCLKSMQEFLPQFYFAERHQRMVRMPFGMPSLRTIFPKQEQRMAIFIMLFALVQTNPRDDLSFIREYWNGETFHRLQATFLDKFPKIWRAVVTDLTNAADLSDDGWVMMHSVVDSIHRCSCHRDNETIPWFVFEVLTEKQRRKFLAFGRSRLMKNESFQYFFASIFKHWPWQNKAFDRYCAGREKFSDSELHVFKHLREYQGWLEKEPVMAGLLPKEACFSIKLENFLHDKRFKSGSPVKFRSRLDY